MTKHIIFDDEDTEHWQLPDDCDVEALRDAIEEAVKTVTATARGSYCSAAGRCNTR